jgi:D-alanyl-D-alanine carboxypeptidase
MTSASPSPSPSNAGVSVKSGSPSSSPSATRSGSPSRSASHSGSPSATPSTTTTVSATPTPTTWRLTVSAPGVHTLKPLLITGTVTAGDANRPPVIAIDRRFGHTWRALTTAVVRWSGDHATFSGVVKDTGRPGAYALRVRLAPKAGTSLIKTFSGVVTAAIDLSVSGPLTRADVEFTYRAGCPVAPSHLRAITMNYWSFKAGTVQRGTLIVRDYTVSDVRRVFTKFFKAHFPIHKMYPVDRYQGFDVRAMAHDDTSAFNCRSVTGNPYRTSQHSYGNAIDINTYENPYVTSGHVYPSRHFLRRVPYRTGMILRGRAVQRAFAAQGWLWGARWSHPDYQHFSSNGG